MSHSQTNMLACFMQALYRTIRKKIFQNDVKEEVGTCETKLNYPKY